MKPFTKTLTLLFIVLSTVSCKKKREFKNEEEFRTWLERREFISKGFDHAKMKNGQIIIPTDQAYIQISDRNRMVFKSDYYTFPYEVHSNSEGGYSLIFKPNQEDSYYELKVTDKECRLLSPCYNTNNNGSSDFYEGPEMETK